MRINQKIQSFFTITTTLCCLLSSSVTSNNYLPKGSSLSAENSETDNLTSPDKTFTCGFYGDSKDNAFWFSIWFTNSKDKTPVWVANRDRPVNGHGSKVSFRGDGALVLTDVDGSTIWQTNTTSSSSILVARAELLNTGNLVLKDFNGKILWQSFDFPTDTLLPHQFFTKSTKLVSSLSKGRNFQSGYFTMLFDNDNVLKLMYDGPEISSLYWPDRDYTISQNGRTDYNSTRVAVLDDMGRFVSSDELDVIAADFGFGVKRRLTLDYDGNLRLYSLNNASGLWDVSWQAMLELCKVHGICGKNGICLNRVIGPACSCPPGFMPTVSGDWTKGCKPLFNTTCPSDPKSMKFIQVQQVDYWGFDLNFTQSVSLDTCKKICLEDCSCVAFSYRLSGEGNCFAKSALFNGYMSPSFPGSIYIKLLASTETSQFDVLHANTPICTAETKVMMGSPSMYSDTGHHEKWVYFYWFASAIGVVEVLFVVLGWWLLLGQQSTKRKFEDGYGVISSQFRRFSYSELKKATKNFKEELGRGGAGIVYKGILGDGRVIAVKRLTDSCQGEDVFWAEVSTIGKMNHMSLVRMWGFCSESKHRLLVYEFMENKSLDKHVFNPNCLNWSERFKVALGTAKGLAYLHHECLEWVIHCDVKPENILLDKEFEPKIADFGLAKLSQRGGDSSEFTRVRGTKGYMAPEWVLNLPITAKVDVYSYGVVILELVKGIRLSNFVIDEDEQVESELSRLVRIVKRKMLIGDDSLIDEAVDLRLNGQYNRNQVATIVKIGVACVEEDRNKRPTMEGVVQALMECEEPKFNLQIISNLFESTEFPASEIVTHVV